MALTTTDTKLKSLNKVGTTNGGISTANNASSNAFDLGTAYDNNQKMQYRQQGIDALKQPEPFKMDLNSIYSDPTYQAAMESARQATQTAEGNISAAMNRRGIMDSTVTANAASNAAQNEYGRVNRELLPKLIEDQYKRYIDQANMNRQYASDLFGVSDMYANDEQTAFNNAITESSVTGQYIPSAAKPIMERLVTLKNSTEALWANLTPEQRQKAKSEADSMRAQLQSMGINPDLFGANVTASAAQGNIGNAGIQTLAAQNQAYNQMSGDRTYNEGVRQYEQNRNDMLDQQEFSRNITMSELTGYLPNGQPTSREQQTQLENLWMVAQQTGRIPDQLAELYGLPRGSSTLDAQKQALNLQRESRIASNSGGSGSRSSNSSSKSTEYTGGVISDPNMPRNASQMETWLINNVPGGKKVQGPVAADQRTWYEGMILNNPNLSESDITKLYNRFGIPLPQ